MSNPVVPPGVALGSAPNHDRCRVNRMVKLPHCYKAASPFEQLVIISTRSECANGERYGTARWASGGHSMGRSLLPRIDRWNTAISTSSWRSIKEAARLGWKGMVSLGWTNAAGTGCSDRTLGYGAAKPYPSRAARAAGHPPCEIRRPVNAALADPVALFLPSLRTACTAPPVPKISVFRDIR